MNVAAYVRCSTDQQEDSPEVQLALIGEYCTREGHTIVAAYADEAVSGGTAIESRAAFKQLLEDRKAKDFSAVVVLKMDRISRDVFDYLTFERAARQHKLGVIFATETYDDTASGSLSKMIKLVFAEHERKQTGERVRQHNRHLAATGRLPSGRPPLGYAYDPATKIISIDEGRADDARTVFETFLDCQGNKSQVARRLNSLGILTRDGGLWRDDGVAVVVRNPFYRGRMHYVDVDVESEAIPRLIPDDVLRAVDSLLAATNGRRTRATQNVYTYSGILVCAKCGSTFKVQAARNGYELYVCRGKKERGICTASMVTTTWLDPLVAEGLHQALAGELAALHAYQQAYEQGEETPDLNARRIQSLEERKARVREMYKAGLCPLEELQGELVEADARIAELSRREPPRVFNADHLEALVANFADNWARMTGAERRKIVLAVSPRIHVHEKGRVTLDTTLRAGIIELRADPLSSNTQGGEVGATGFEPATP